ncbi:hypothetical protein TNCV_471461 [Trichonephila clavipes]|nr:hypothetical protein TNCV_471461 [Trichonephila clavipes]
MPHADGNRNKSPSSLTLNPNGGDERRIEEGGTCFTPPRGAPKPNWICRDLKAFGITLWMAVHRKDPTSKTRIHTTGTTKALDERNVIDTGGT